MKPHQLWIGHAADGRALEKLHELGIRAIVQLAYEELPAQPPRELICYRFPLLDGGGNDPALLCLAIESVTRLLNHGMPTLVCCGAGMSRSPAIVAAAISEVESAGLEDCLKRIAELRAVDVSPKLWEDVHRMSGARKNQASTGARLREHS